MDRTFKIADSRLLEHCGVALESLKSDLTGFTGFDPDLNEDKVTHLGELYKTTLEEGGDDVVKGVVGEKTQTLLRIMDRCDRQVTSLRYWAKKAFRGDPAGLKRFRLTQYWRIRNNQAKLIAFMSALTTVVKGLRVTLENAKTPADLLDSFEGLTKELETANNVQENSKGSRGSATQARVARLNELYTICVEFSDAAEFIHSGDPAKRELYRVPGNSQPSTDDEEPEEQDEAA